MGGFDSADHLRVSRSVERRSRKPYMPLFYWSFDAILTNVWILYRHNSTTNSTKGMRRNFHMDVIHGLASLALVPQAQSGNHYPRKSSNYDRKRCFV